MPEDEKSIEALLENARELYARFILAGCIEGWEDLDAVLRSDASPAARLGAFCYTFSGWIGKEDLPETLSVAAAKFFAAAG